MASKISLFKNQPCNRLYPKKPAGTHWLGNNDAVSWLNKAKTRIFQPTANFEIFEIYLYFVCLPAVRPGCARCRAPEISHDKGNGGGFTKMMFRSVGKFRKFQNWLWAEIFELSMALWEFLLSFFPLPCSSLFL